MNVQIFAPNKLRLEYLEPPDSMVEVRSLQMMENGVEVDEMVAETPLTYIMGSSFLCHKSSFNE